MSNNRVEINAYGKSILTPMLRGWATSFEQDAQTMRQVAQSLGSDDTLTRILLSCAATSETRAIEIRIMLTAMSEEMETANG